MTINRDTLCHHPITTFDDTMLFLQTYKHTLARIVSQMLTMCLLLLTTGTSQATQLGERGAFRVTFTADELFNENQRREYSEFFSMDQEISWEVFVPDNYDPVRPSGVLTYVSPTRSGLIPENWKPVFSRRNLIWISANKSGNNAGLLNRSVYAILGTELIRNSYAVDDARVYVSGFSGGGRMASMLIHRYHHLYTGAIYICGVNHWEDLPKRDVAAMLKRRHVFLTGTKDFNYRDTTDVSRLYKEAGLKNYKVMVIEGMGHRLPDPPDLAIALDYLDATP